MCDANSLLIHVSVTLTREFSYFCDGNLWFCGVNLVGCDANSCVTIAKWGNSQFY